MKKGKKLERRKLKGGKMSESRFKDNGDGTVTDSVTDLMWQKTTVGEMTWTEALSYCKRLSLGGHEDWRLPTLQELHSLIDHRYCNPAIDTTAFPDTVSFPHWSSTTYAFYTDGTLYTGGAWFVHFSSGSIGYSYKSSTHYVRAVRDNERER